MLYILIIFIPNPPTTPIPYLQPPPNFMSFIFSLYKSLRSVCSILLQIGIGPWLEQDHCLGAITRSCQLSTAVCLGKGLTWLLLLSGRMLNGLILLQVLLREHSLCELKCSAPVLSRRWFCFHPRPSAHTIFLLLCLRWSLSIAGVDINVLFVV